MANNRVNVPSFGEIQKQTIGEGKSVNRWLNTLMSEENPDIPQAEDKDFEVDNGNNSSRLSVTSSSNPARPRTLKAGYDYKTKILTVVFRKGVWWEYRNVEPDLWLAFQSAPSKGKFLAASGLDQWDDMGPADIVAMPKHRRIQMSSTKELADYMYNKRKNR
jgi:KTSC domain